MAHTIPRIALAALLTATWMSRGHSSRIGEPPTSGVEEPQASQRRGSYECREKSVKDVCECNEKNAWGQYQCTGCKDKQKWGYGCKLDCPEHCPYGCDFLGNCIVPNTCKRNGRVDHPSPETEVRNLAGECQACDKGYYGLYCTEQCPSNCKDSSTEGVCTRGGKCYKCLEGWYGETCEEKCPAACPKCAMRGDIHEAADGSGEFLPAGACLTECKKNMWGDTCEQKCPSNCKNSRIPSCLKHNGNCLKCQGHLWWGDKCEHKCAEGCIDGMCQKSDGVCEKGCKDSFYGDKCDHNCYDGCGGTHSCDRQSGDCTDGCVLGKWGPMCSRTCPDHMADGAKCDQTNAMPEACEDGRYPDFMPGGSKGACLECPKTCKDSKCDKEGKCAYGCEVGFYGEKCEHLCAPKCNGPCDKPTTGKTDSHCAECVDGFTGKRCTKRCHASCKSCEKYGNAITDSDCTSCKDDDPTELKDGKCDCIAHATFDPKVLPHGQCVCNTPEDPKKIPFFDKSHGRKLCRERCKPGLMEVYGKEGSKHEHMSTCLTKEVFNEVLKQESKVGSDGFQQGSCAAGEYEFTCTEEEKVCIAEDYVKSIID